jgi:hypothetical protein
MCKELPVLVNKVVDPKRTIGKKWRAEEEERHKGSLTQKSMVRAAVLQMTWVRIRTRMKGLTVIV